MDIENLIESSHQSSVFARSWWLDAVAPGRWDYITIEEGGKVVAAMPIVRIGRNILMPPLTQTLGILYEPIRGSYPRIISKRQKLALEIIDQLPSFHSFSQHFNYNFTDWLPFYWRGFNQTTRYTYVLEDLNRLDNIMMGMRKRLRLEINRARGKFEITMDISNEDFNRLCKLTYDKIGIKYPRSTVDRIIDACKENNSGRIFSAQSRTGEILATILFVGDFRSTYYLLSGSNQENDQPGVLSMLIWEGIKYAANFSMNFDFEGSMIERVSGKFRRFGGVQKPYSLIWKDNTIGFLRKKGIDLLSPIVKRMS
jgi:hypothetical protein